MIRAWIAAHHPTVLQGDTTINVVTIVVDMNNNYVMSRAGKLPPSTSVRAKTIDAGGRVVPIIASEDSSRTPAPRLIVDGTEFVSIAFGHAIARNDLIERSSIAAVQVFKYAPGAMAPGQHFSVVIIAQK